MGAVLALLCLLSLGSDATRALCLDLGGHCSTSAFDTEGPCHDQGAGRGPIPDCGSCVDVPIPGEASASGGQPDPGSRPLVAQHSFGAPGPISAAPAGSPSGLPASAAGRLAQDFSSRSAALRI